MHDDVFGKSAVDILADADEHSRRESAFGKIFAIGRCAGSATAADGFNAPRFAVQRRNGGYQVAFFDILHLRADLDHIPAEFMPRHAGK